MCNVTYPAVPVGAISAGKWGEMAQKGFISDMVAPVVNMPVSKGKYERASSQDDQIETGITRPDEIPSAPSNTYKDVVFDIETKRFNEMIKREDYMNHPSPGKKKTSLERMATIRNTRKARLWTEKKCADKVFNKNNWSTYDDCDVLWSDYANATPITDLLKLAQAIQDRFNMYVTAAVFSASAYSKFGMCSQVLNKLPTQMYQGIQKATALALLKQGSLEYLENIYIGRQGYTISNRGRSDSSDILTAKLWTGDKVLLYVEDLNPSEEGTEGAIVGLTNNGLAQPKHRPWRNEGHEEGTEMREATIKRDILIVEPDLGGILDASVADAGSGDQDGSGADG